MDISNQIRTRREAMGLSQEDLAAKVYVSRQTVSNWERDRTYPDVQSLLILSELFGTSLDTLVKGDVDVMDETIERDRKLRRRITAATTAIFVLILAVTWVTNFTPLMDRAMETVGIIPALLIQVAFIVLLMVIDVRLLMRDQEICRKHDLKTYRELRAFQRGEHVDRDPDLRARLGLLDRLTAPEFDGRKLGAAIAVACILGLLTGFIVGFTG